MKLGAGLDFYLTYFKLSVELKMSSGIGDVLVNEAAPGSCGICIMPLKK